MIKVCFACGRDLSLAPEGLSCPWCDEIGPDEREAAMPHNEQGHDYHMVEKMLEHLDLWLDNQVPGIIPWHLLAAQCRWESSFNPCAVSSAGAKGIAQFMPDTWREIGHGDPFDVAEAVKAQSKYMLWLAMLHAWTFKSTPFWWVLSYTWGFGAVKRVQVTDEVPRTLWNHALSIMGTSEYYRRLLSYVPGVNR